jgi:hypothetical protein
MTLANTANFNATVPAAPGGNVNVVFQDDGGTPTVNISGYVPVGAGIGTFTQEVVTFSGTSGTLAHTPVVGGFFALYRNGVLMAPSGAPAIQTYSISGTGLGLSTAAVSGEWFYALYYH